MENNLSLPFETLGQIKHLCTALIEEVSPQWCQYTLFGLYFKQRLWKDYEEYLKVHLPYVRRVTRIWDLTEHEAHMSNRIRVPVEGGTEYTKSIVIGSRFRGNSSKITFKQLRRAINRNVNRTNLCLGYERFSVNGLPDTGHCMLLTKFNSKIYMMDRALTDSNPVKNYINMGRGSDGQPLQLGKNKRTRNFLVEDIWSEELQDAIVGVVWMVSSVELYFYKEFKGRL